MKLRNNILFITTPLTFSLVLQPLQLDRNRVVILSRQHARIGVVATDTPVLGPARCVCVGGVVDS
jgi:hypothetical protein